MILGGAAMSLSSETVFPLFSNMTGRTGHCWVWNLRGESSVEFFRAQGASR